MNGEYGIGDIEGVRFYDSQVSRDKISALVGHKINFRRRFGVCELELGEGVAREGDWVCLRKGAFFVLEDSEYRRMCG